MVLRCIFVQARKRPLPSVWIRCFPALFFAFLVITMVSSETVPLYYLWVLSFCLFCFLSTKSEAIWSFIFQALKSMMMLRNGSYHPLPTSYLVSRELSAREISFLIMILFPSLLRCTGTVRLNCVTWTFFQSELCILFIYFLVLTKGHAYWF